ncbi:hypothetical protein DSO57_1029543 [Entomophthora muscae]|uniref:Uncharacterized protein n=1 Tax=Entomophthora muscae TaxID=34485 RepID=A0ACC2TZC5_9FUNG|nr:hypothetical protein DSO57_1029543 [Entomophthora muscae]
MMYMDSVWLSMIVRIVNSSSLETRAQEWESNPDPLRPPGLWTAGPPAHVFLESTPQADTENIGLCSETGQNKEIITPNGRLITAPNGGTEAATISFMNLKSTPVANQEPSQERVMGLTP